MARQFLLLFVGTFFICQFVLMMQFLWRYIDELIGKGLTMDVLAQFFWYMSLMLVPQALPLAILLSSLIAFGNLGESSELTAIKAAGISLLQSMRSLIFIVLLIAGASFYFQNVVAPKANMSFAQLLLSMKQKSPELEIPEGVFYDGIPGANIYVQKKNIETGKLYGIMIYQMTSSFDDAAIILADSGMLQSTADKKHLLLSLWSGEWFENMKNSEVAGNAAVPYRRETFTSKRIVKDFDADFNLADASVLANNARGKSLSQIRRDLDSLNQTYDSIGRAYYNSSMIAMTPRQKARILSEGDMKRAQEMASTKPCHDAGAVCHIRDRIPSNDNIRRRRHHQDAQNRGDKQVHTGAVVPHILLHRCAVGRNNPQGRTGSAGDYLRDSVHHLLHLRQHRLPYGT